MTMKAISLSLCSLALCGTDAKKKLGHRNRYKPEFLFGDTHALNRTNITPFVQQNNCNRHGDHHNAKCNKKDKIGVTFNAEGLEWLLEDIPDNAAANTLHSITDRVTGAVTFVCCGEERVMDYTTIADQMFNHLLLNYNPEGHFPPGVYGAPHFDFHWYFTSVETRESITTPFEDERCDTGGDFAQWVDCDTLSRLQKFVPDEYYPGGDDSDWVCLAAEPTMGEHCLSTAQAEELFADPAETFVATPIMTRQDGYMTSNEAMITVDAFKALHENSTANEICESYEVPKRYIFGKGCYPTSYCYGCGDWDGLGENVCWAYLTDYVHLS